VKGHFCPFSIVTSLLLVDVALMSGQGGS
jgi:hypothetical protein